MTERGVRIVAGIFLILPIVTVLRGGPGYQTITAADRTARERGVVGNVGCSASACHGGTPSPATPACSANAYTNWQLADPHARAYRILFDERSRQIARNLAGAAEPIPAHEDVRCLACHVTPQLAEVERSPLHAEGVGCEACHGPARDWLSAHTTWAEPSSKREAYESHGMIWLNDPAGRAAVCAGCHVGAPEDPERGLPKRDVNHDLIAAGHPRLGFEMLTYQNSLPPHWQEYDRETVRAGSSPEPKPEPEFALRVWLAGQVETTKAALLLSTDRSSQPEHWPELAEFDCFCCHHNLDPQPPGKNWRQRTAYHDAGASFYQGSRRPGEPIWSAWNYSFPLHKLAEDEVRPTASAWFETMNRPYPEPELVKREAAAFASELSRWHESARNAPLDAWLVERLAPTEAEAARLGWAEAAQIYYALNALRRYRDEIGEPFPEDAADQLASLRSTLRFPRDAETGWFDSPKDFRQAKDSDPIGVIGRLFGALGR